MAQVTTLPRRSRSVIRSLVAQHLAARGRGPLKQLKAWGAALRAVWRERMDIVTFLKSGDEALAHALRQRFGLGGQLGTAQVVPDSLFVTPQNMPPPQAASIIIPIFNAAETVKALLARLPATLPLKQHVILVDDGSKDPQIELAMNTFQSLWPETVVVRHAENKGFVAAVNTALEHLPKSHHAIILNSDTMPPPDWVPRLLAPFGLADDIASITPLSNNAEILSVPRAGLPGTPTPHMIETMDTVARKLSARQVDLPTGIGFCIALNRTYLDQIGGFDASFGKGYGEEVDWCQKALALGGRHVAATNLLVGHQGNASFGEAARRTRIANASRIIAKRYPGYAQAALDWERSDPIAPERLALALAWTAATTPNAVPIYIAHALGGGAETALQCEVSAALANGAPAVVILRVGGPAVWRIELRGTRFALAGDVNSGALLHRLLEPFTQRHVIYSCAVHAADPEAIPETLLRLSDGHRLSLRLHDFFPISPSWNLLGEDGRYRGIPPVSSEDPAHTLGQSHRAWRVAWGQVIDAADEVTVFAKSGGALFTEAYPNAAPKIVLRPHQPFQSPAPLPPGGQTLGILGGINHPKGAAVLESLARHSSRRIAVIGALDGKFHLPAPHIVHGPYDQKDIARLAQRYDVGAWFVPSICPETFSFATHEALATGLPVASFNLGAQADALAPAPNGVVFDLDPEETASVAKEIEALFK